MARKDRSEEHGEKDRWMRVLGVDPAAAGPTGYGIVEGNARGCRMLHYGALKIDTKRQVPCSGSALQDVHELMCRLIEEYSPDVLAVESVFSALNVRTALLLAEVRGVVLLAAAQHGLEVHSYAPRQVKANIAGHGHADKRQMQTMVQTLLSMSVIPEPADAADALAVALCHLQVERVRRRFGLSDKNAVQKPCAPRKASGSSSTMATVQIGTATRTRLPRILSTR